MLSSHYVYGLVNYSKKINNWVESSESHPKYSIRRPILHLCYVYATVFHIFSYVQMICAYYYNDKEESVSKEPHT